MQKVNKERFWPESAEIRQFYPALEEKELTIRQYNKKERVQKLSLGEEYSGLLTSGLLMLIGESESGRKSLIEYYTPGDFISSNSLMQLGRENCRLFAKKSSRIAYFSNKTVLKLSLEQENESLYKEFFLKPEAKAMTHLIVLEQHSLRDKLMCFFSFLSSAQNSNDIYLPLTISDIADYICADRSAMSREIKKMNDDKLILSSGRKIKLLLPLKPYI